MINPASRPTAPLWTSSPRTPVSIALLTAALCLLAGCAAEAPPRPPRIQNPQAVHDLSAAQTGRSVTLTFTTPTRATDGRSLTKPIEVEIFRSVAPPGKAGTPVFTGTQPWVHVRPAGLDRFKRGPLFVYPYALSPTSFAAKIGETWTFGVATLTRSFRGRPRMSALSNIVRITLLNVSPAIRGLRITQAPGALELRWSAPAQGLAPGVMARPSGYRVYRGQGSLPASMALLAETPNARYADRDFRFGQTYAYRVRAVFEQGAMKAESPGSAPVEIIPRRIFPPPPPVGLTGVYTGRAVQLIWNAVSAPALAGYNIYRRPVHKPAIRLNRTLLRAPAFADASVQPNLVYEYWVTAVDQEGNESQPSARIVVRTQ